MAAERSKRHSKDKPYYVTFFDIPKAALVHYTSKILEPPFSNPIMLVDVDRSGGPFGDYEEEDVGTIGLKYEILEATGRKHRDYLGMSIGGWPSFTERGFEDDILSKTRTFVFNGASLNIERFREHALPAIKSFFRQGGTVLLIGGDCEAINEAFGCQWRQVHRREYYPHDLQCVPTDDALLFLGTDSDGRLLVPETIYIGEASLVAAGRGGALYIARPFETKRQFLEKEGNIDDFWYDDESGTILKDKFFEMYPRDKEGLNDILKAEKKWEKYKRMMATPVALHLDPNDGGGSVVRIGDKRNEDTRMRSVLARLMTTNFHATKEAMKEKTKYRGRYAYSTF